MDKEFKNTFLTNLLITAMLIPEILIINALISILPDPTLWIIVGSIMFIILTYLTYLNNKSKKRGVPNVKDRH